MQWLLSTTGRMFVWSVLLTFHWLCSLELPGGRSLLPEHLDAWQEGLCTFSWCYWIELNCCYCLVDIRRSYTAAAAAQFTLFPMWLDKWNNKKKSSVLNVDFKSTWAHFSWIILCFTIGPHDPFLALWFPDLLTLMNSCCRAEMNLRSPLSCSWLFGGAAASVMWRICCIQCTLVFGWSCRPVSNLFILHKWYR